MNELSTIHALMRRALINVNTINLGTGSKIEAPAIKAALHELDAFERNSSNLDEVQVWRLVMAAADEMKAVADQFDRLQAEPQQIQYAS